MDFGKKFGVDQELAGGTWIDVGDDGTQLLIAAMPNPKFSRFLDQHRQRYRMAGEDIPESIYEEAIAKTVLLDWRKVEDEGMEIESTEVNRLEILRRYPPFKSIVINAATDVRNFQRKAEAAAIKN